MSTPLLRAQADSLTLASGAVSGSNVTLALSLNSPAGSEPAAVQWTLTYPGSNVASVTAVAGASLTSAAKTISCTGSEGSYSCVASGTNTSIITNGVVASITLTMTAAASSTQVTLAAAGADASGGALKINATGGTVSGGGITSSGGTGSSGSGSGSGTSSTGSGTGTTSTGTGTSSTGSGTGTTSTGSGTGTTSTGSGTGTSSPTSGSGTSSTGSGTGTSSTGSGTGTSSTGSGTGTSSTGSGTGTSSTGSGTGTSSTGSGTGTSSTGSGSGTSSTGSGSGTSSTGSGSGTSSTGTGTGTSSTGSGTGTSSPTSGGGGTSGTGGSGGGGSGSTSGGTTVASLACNPSKLIGGSPTNCVVTLTDPAPAAGQPVLLFAFTTVGLMPAWPPPSITIPPTAQSGTFVVTTSPVTSVVTVLIAAETGAVGKYTTIVLGPGGSSTSSTVTKSNALAGTSSPRLSCIPRTVTAPGTVTCELQLATGSAEARSLALSSNDPSLHVPGAVTVRPHQSSLSFQAIVDETAPSATLSIQASAGERSAADLSSEERITVIARTEIAHVAPPRTPADAAGGGPSGGPQIRSVGNAASGSADSVCTAGSLAAIDGTELARGEDSDPLGGSLVLAGTRVTVNGTYVPLVYASASKVVFLCPAGAAAPLSVSIETGDGGRVTASVAVRDSAPGIFTADASGQGQAAATIFNGSRLAMARNYRYSSEPAQPGDTMSIAMTGLSAAADPSRLSVVIGDLRVPIDDVHATPGRAGVEQVAVTIPSAAPTGDAVPIIVEELLPDGSFASSQKATIAIEPVRR